MKYQKLLSTKVKELRLKHNLTQEEFAEKIGLSLNGVSNIERNRYQPTANTIDKICSVFQITPVELLIQNSTQNSDIMTNINSLLSNCPQKTLKKIYDIILIMLK